MLLYLHLITDVDHRIIPAEGVKIVHSLKEGTVFVTTADGERIKCDPSILYGSLAECADVANSYAEDGQHDSFIFAAIDKKKKQEPR